MSDIVVHQQSKGVTLVCGAFTFGRCVGVFPTYTHRNTRWDLLRIVLGVELAYAKYGFIRITIASCCSVSRLHTA